MAGTVTTPTFEAADRHLRKTMPLEHLLFLSVGTIIGSGWLFASLQAAGIAGPAAIIAWVIGAVFITLMALGWAELGAMLPRSGAIVRYPHLTHGAFTGWIMGWAYWLGAVSTPAIEAEAVITYLSGRFPQVGLATNGVLSGKGIGCGIGLVIIFFILNYVGIRFLSEWNRWFVWWKIVIPVATFCFLFVIFKGSNYTAYSGFAPHGVPGIFQALALSGIVFAYLGYRQSIEYGGESRNPQRDIPIGTVGSILIAMVIYTVLQAAFIGALDWRSAGVEPGNWTGLMHSSWASGPLYNALNAAGVASLASFGTVLLIDAGVSPAGTGWISLGTSTRNFYGLSIDGYFPRLFQWMNPFGIPWVALLGSAVVACVFFIPAPSWYVLVAFVTSTTVLSNMMGSVGLPVLRRLAPTMHRPFYLPLAELLAPAGFLAAAVIVYWAGFVKLNNVFAAILVALPLFAWYYAWQRGWTGRVQSAVLGLVFLGAWLYLSKMGGWTLSASGQVPGSWSFPIYDIAFSADVVFFFLGLWALSNGEGRQHVQRAAWLIWLMLAMLPLSYWGEYGPLKPPTIGFPWSTLIMVGVGLVAYYWSALSGFATEELKQILAAGGQEVGDAPLPLLPGYRGLPWRQPAARSAGT